MSGRFSLDNHMDAVARGGVDRNSQFRLAAPAHKLRLCCTGSTCLFINFIADRHFRAVGTCCFRMEDQLLSRCGLEIRPFRNLQRRCVLRILKAFLRSPVDAGGEITLDLADVRPHGFELLILSVAACIMIHRDIPEVQRLSLIVHLTLDLVIASGHAAVREVLECPEAPVEQGKIGRRVAFRQEIILLCRRQTHLRAEPGVNNIRVGTELSFLALALIAFAVQPRAVAVCQGALAAQNFFLHEFRLQGVLTVALRHHEPGISVASHLQRLDKRNAGEKLRDMVPICGILLAAGCDDNLLCNLLLQCRPLGRVSEFFINIHQRPRDGVGSAPDLQIQRALVVIQNPLPDQLGAFRLLLHFSFIADIADFGDGPKVIRRRIAVRVFNQVRIILFIVVNDPEHPVCSRPAVRCIERSAVLKAEIISALFLRLYRTGDTDPVKFGRGLHDALQIHLVGIKQKMPKRILIVDFRVLCDDGPDLHRCLLS